MLHRRSEPRGFHATISARYDWSVARQSTSFPLRHWNLRNLSLQQESYLTNTVVFRSLEIFSACTVLSYGSIMLPPRQPRQPRVFAWLALGWLVGN